MTTKLRQVPPLQSSHIPGPLGLWTGAIVLGKGGNEEIVLHRWSTESRINGAWRLPLMSREGNLYTLNVCGLGERVASRIGVSWAEVSPMRMDLLCSLILLSRWFPGCPHNEAAWEGDHLKRWEDWAQILSTASIYLSTVDRLHSLPIWRDGLEKQGARSIPAFTRTDGEWTFLDAQDAVIARFDYVGHIEDWRTALQAVYAKEADRVRNP